MLDRSTVRRLLPDPALEAARALRFALVGTRESLLPRYTASVRNHPRPYTSQGSLPGPFLVGSGAGCLHYSDAGLRQLFDGDVYGITRGPDWWYAFRRADETGQLLAFDPSGGRVDELHVVRSFLSGDIHQIDWIDGSLYLCDTANNRLLVHELTDDGLDVASADRYYPPGRLSNDRQSPNYAHLNSVYALDGRCLVVYHNDTENTGDSSELALLDENLNEDCRIPLEARCAHNVLAYDGDFWWCDSLAREEGGRLVRDGEALFEHDLFLRGLSLSGDVILVGGSEIADRRSRDSADGWIFALGPDGEEHGRIHVPDSGGINEIRRVQASDLSLSQDAPDEIEASSSPVPDLVSPEPTR